MNYEDVKKILKKFKMLPQQPKIEKTIFSVGILGYYENPTTDLLAFFSDDNEAHGLGALVLSSLVDCLPEKYQSIDKSLNGNTPMREITTSSGRIDLLLEGEQWVICLENKVFHHQINPFENYEKWINDNYCSKPDKIFVILSPYGGEKQKNWEMITYEAFITKIKERLSEHFIEHPLNKWIVLLREFVLHLESVMYKEKSLDNESVAFIFDNFSSILELESLKKRVIKDYQQYIQKELFKKIDKEIGIRLDYWSGYPAMRFYFKAWKTNSDLVLFWSKENDKFGINFYINIENDTRIQAADNYVTTETCSRLWVEQNSKYRCYRHSGLFTFDSYNEIISAVEQRLNEIDKYEQLP